MAAVGVYDNGIARAGINAGATVCAGISINIKHNFLGEKADPVQIGSS